MKRLLPILLLVFSVGVGAETITYQDSQYVGDVLHGVPHGQGTLTFSSGNQYVGEWKDDRSHGQGTFTWANGDRYVGRWRDDKLDGQGAFTWADGRKYVGEYKADNFHGEGTYTWPNGSKYVGAWNGGKYHGQGTYTYANKGVYAGEWKVGKYHGQGTLTIADGAKEVGKWKHGHLWSGTRYYESGNVEGLMSDGLSAPACELTSAEIDGLGFAVNERYVVTNAHVLFCCKKVTIRDLGTCSYQGKASVVATDLKSDLGLLRLDKRIKWYAKVTGARALQLGEVISAYDSPPSKTGNCKYVMRQGKVTKLDWLPDDSRLMTHSISTIAGSSGGPVMDDSGDVVGVTQGGRVTTVGQSSPDNYAIKRHLLEAFLKSNNVEYKTALSNEKLSLSEVKKKSGKFTVIIECTQ